MPKKPLVLIGASQGWGAARHEAQWGPQVLHDYGLVPALQQVGSQVQWQTVINSSVSFTAGKKLKYAERLMQVQDFSTRLAKEIIDCQPSNFPIVLGGDHSIAIGTWSALVTALKAPSEFGLIWIDAHMDSHTPATTPSHNIHGMPLAALLGYGENALINICSEGPKLNPRHVVLIGVRSFEPEEAKLLKDLNVKIFYMSDVKALGFKPVFQQALEIVTNGTKGFGISIDLDAFDPSVAPGTGTPVADGIQEVEEVMESLKTIKENPQFKALEIVEFDSSRDSQHKTAEVIKKLILSIL